MTAAEAPHSCSLAAMLKWVGERWTFFVLREALLGTTRFSDFRAALGVAPDVLAGRLATLVDAGIMTRQSYQEPGQRARESYHLTATGQELSLVIAALQQWGDAYACYSIDSGVDYRAPDGRPVSVAFVDDRGRVVPAAEVVVGRVAPDGPVPDGPVPNEPSSSRSVRGAKARR